MNARRKPDDDLAVLPARPDAEKSLLGAILTDGALFRGVSSFVSSDDFSTEAHRYVYQACQAITERGDGVDLVTVQNELQRAKKLERAGGPAYLAALVDAVPDVDNAPSYARIVRETSVRRELIITSRRTIAAATSEEELSIVVKRIRTDIERLPEDGIAGKRAFPWVDLMAFRDELKVITRTRQPTGFPSLDKALGGGLPGGVVTCFVGPPGSLKSALALQIGLERARKNRGRMYVYAPDQGGAQPLTRLADTFGDIVDDEDSFTRFLHEVGSTLCVADERQRGVTIESFAEAVEHAGDAQAVMIDTPQTVMSTSEEEDRKRIDLTMDLARRLASKLLVPVFVPSHANRAGSAARNKEDRNRPVSAGHGSAQIEHRSQFVVFMENVVLGDDEDETKSTTIIELEVAKAPKGHVGRTCRIALDPATWKLREVDMAGVLTAKEQKAAEKQATKQSEAEKLILDVLRRESQPLSSKALEERCGGNAQMHRKARTRLANEALIFGEERVDKGGGLEWRIASTANAHVSSEKAKKVATKSETNGAENVSENR